MAQTSWPFENIDTTETQFSQWARNINEGIRQGSGSELVVGAPGGAMTVTVGTGQAMIRGHYYSSDAVETLTIAAANPSNPRIDSVVLELDPTANTVILKVLTGTPAGSPVAPSLTQTDAGVYQIRLANVAVGAGVLQITSGNITDLRPKMWSGVGNWTTITRPANPIANSTIGYNTTTSQHEYWNGTSWVNLAQDLSTLIPKSIIDAQGDLIIGASNDTPVRLARGSAGAILRSTSTDTSWLAPGGTGSLLLGGSNPSWLSVGTNGQVLGSNGTSPVWTTPAASTTWTLITSQAIPTGAATSAITFTNTNSDKIMIVATDLNTSATTDTFYFALGHSSTPQFSHANSVRIRMQSTGTPKTFNSASGTLSAIMGLRTTNNTVQFAGFFSGARNSNGVMEIDTLSGVNITTSTQTDHYWYKGLVSIPSGLVFNRIQFESLSGTFTGGNIAIYGA